MSAELSFGQKIDDNGLIMPWLTHLALDEISSIDLSDKIVLMFGAGLGDAWLAKRCKKLYVVERNGEWLMKAAEICQMNVVDNIEYLHRPCNDCSGMDEYYCQIPEGVRVDVLINDDAYRFEVIVKALTLPRPLVLITDNWMQDYVFLCPKGEELLKDFEHTIYPCTTHTNHEGNCWKTAIHYLK